MTGVARWVSRRRRGAAAFAACALWLAGCTPLYVPPVPDLLAPEPAWRIAGDAHLEVVTVAEAGTRLRLEASFASVAAPGWVAVQWFGPVGTERASAATWVTDADVGRGFVWWSPPDLELAPGAWRALVSVDGRVLRQFDVEIAAP